MDAIKKMFGGWVYDDSKPQMDSTTINSDAESRSRSRSRSRRTTSMTRSSDSNSFKKGKKNKTKAKGTRQKLKKGNKTMKSRY
jgi:hypothetical protein